jgi:outer membrane protein, multidrug efflux system
MNNMNKRVFILSLLVFFLGGCTLAPKYMRPKAPVPAHWPTGAAYGQTSAASASSASAVMWRDFITDKRLQKVIETALNNNRDLRIAALNVERARALYGIQRAELYPTIDAVGSWSKTRIPADLTTTGRAITADQYSVNLGLSSWEIDFFGRIRSLKKSALEEYLASDEARRSVQILLVSTAAQAYMTLAADQEALKLVKSALEVQEATYQLIEKRFSVGISTGLDLQRAKSQVDAARGDVARYTQQTALDENALNLLVGSSLPSGLLPWDLASVIPPKEISPGLSSEVLLRRPDVMAAEHQLKAANANIGAARADFFPRISLTTFFGTASTDLSGLFKAGQATWSFAPQVMMPIFDARTWNAYEVTKIDRELSVAQYEKTIQTAFREVADALAVRGTVNQQITAQQSLVEDLTQTYRLALARYSKGIDNYLSVLDAQRSLYSAQQVLIDLHLAKLANLATLYKALGGGNW